MRTLLEKAHDFSSIGTLRPHDCYRGAHGDTDAMAFAGRHANRRQTSDRLDYALDSGALSCLGRHPPSASR
jgi:hypothetical protein